MNLTDIGQKIIVMRATTGMTQQALAKALDTSQRTVASWETGDSVPRKAMRVKIAQVFQMDDLYFLNQYDEEGKLIGNDETQENAVGNQGVNQTANTAVNQAGTPTMNGIQTLPKTMIDSPSTTKAGDDLITDLADKVGILFAEAGKEISEENKNLIMDTIQQVLLTRK